jgi:hypothetical protein
LVKYLNLHRRYIPVRLRATLALAPMVVAAAIALSATAAHAKKTKPPQNVNVHCGANCGNIQVGFVGVPPPGFQNALINVIAVSVNPKSTAAPDDPRWVNINVPINAGVGVSAKPGVLQFDLNQIQTVPALFNTQAARADNYQLALITLDPVNPGTLVPTCPNELPGTGTLEGCINYPVQLQNAGIPIEFPLSPGIPVAKNTLSQILFQLNMSIVTAPTVTGGAYTVKVTAAPIPASKYMAAVTGTVTGVKNTKKLKKTRSLSVTAELMGTNTIVASAPVFSGNFTLSLPAAPDLGSLYDVFISGGKVTYDATRLAPVFPGTNAGPTFAVKGNQKLGSISGKISDKCTGQPITGATLQLLLPPDTNSSADCMTAPQECVTVASASTDNSGTYPIPGTAQTPAPFSNVPVGQNLTMEISAPGYDTLLTPVSATGSSKKGTCPNASTANTCNFSLTTAYIVGTLNLTANPPSGTSVIAQVFAEEHGTSNIVSALAQPLTINSTTSGADFVLNVPTVGSFDLFASAIDLFQGAPDPYPGHSIVVASDVSPAVVCPAPSSPDPAATLAPMDCIGHGSITSTAPNPDTGTTVLLSKDGVDLMSMPVIAIPPAAAPNDVFTFCVPGDDYELQRLEAVVPSPGSVPTAPATPTAVGTPEPVAVPIAAPTSTGCPTTCSSSGGTCPGVCANVIPNPLQP